MAINVTPFVARLLVCFVCILIFFLAYPSQYFILRNRAYAPWWSTANSLWFNFCVGSIWVGYYRSVRTDPGGLPAEWVPDGVDEMGGVGKGGNRGEDGANDEEGEEEKVGRMSTGRLWGKGVGRWCKKCEGWKPPRCHHCRKCERCVLRMDHHCPWTNNCVGYRNLPHFLRFLCYATYTTLYLEYHLILICLEFWDLPSTYSPPLPTLTFLIILILINTLTTFSLTLLTLRTLYSTAGGTTTIEEWEKERHSSLVRRKVVKRVIFPWDIGIWENLVEAMGGGGWWGWWWAGARTRKVWPGEAGKSEKKRGWKLGGKEKSGKNWNWERDGGGGVRWEVNGFEDPSTPWPPRDPEREPVINRRASYANSTRTTALDDKEYIAAFRRRQQADLKRWQKPGEDAGQEIDTYEDEEGDENKKNDDASKPKSGGSWDGVWRNEDGATLADYGVDEDAEGGLVGVGADAAGGGYTSVGINSRRTGNAGAVGTGADYGQDYNRNYNHDDDEDVSLAELLRKRRGGGGHVAEIETTDYTGGGAGLGALSG